MCTADKTLKVVFSFDSKRATKIFARKNYMMLSSSKFVLKNNPWSKYHMGVAPVEAWVRKFHQVANVTCERLSRASFTFWFFYSSPCQVTLSSLLKSTLVFSLSARFWSEACDFLKRSSAAPSISCPDSLSPCCFRWPCGFSFRNLLQI